MIGDPQRPVLQIDKFGRDLDRQDLATAVAERFLAEGEAAQQQAAVRGLLALADEVGILGEWFAGDGQSEQRIAVPGRQFDMPRPPARQSGKGMDVGQCSAPESVNLIGTRLTSACRTAFNANQP